MSFAARRSFNRMVPMCTVLLAAACGMMRTGSDYYPAADFSKLHTYAWMADSPLIHSQSGRIDISPLTVRRVQEAIERELVAKGYEDAAGGGADFGVSFTIGARDLITTQAYPPQYWTHWSWQVPYYWPNVDAQMYTEGALAIDVFDNATHEPVWHGWARKPILGRDVDNPQAAIDAAVAAILADFPPK